VVVCLFFFFLVGGLAASRRAAAAAGAGCLVALVCCDHALVFFLSVEGGTLAFLVIMMGSRAPKALEGATRYFLASSICSVVLLASVWHSLISGSAPELWSWPRTRLGPLVMAVLVFKLSLFPLHFLFPDLIEASPLGSLPVWAGWMKLALFIVFLKLFTQIGMSVVWLTLMVGALGAVAQSKVLRSIAYFSINSAGWLVLGASAGLPLLPAFFAAFFVVYALSIHGVVSWWRCARLRPGSFLVELGGFSPPVGLPFSALALSWLGIPPLAAFWWKWEILVSVANHGGYASMMIALLWAAVVLFFVLRVIRFSSFSGLPGRAPVLSFSVPLFAGGFVVFVALSIGFLWSSLLVMLAP
jgi:NADH-quinone oxidoreductase subunit N